MDRRPNHINKVAFSHFSGVVQTLSQRNKIYSAVSALFRLQTLMKSKELCLKNIQTSSFLEFISSNNLANN